MEELTNQLPDFSLLINYTEASVFLEQLATAPNFSGQVVILDNFFLNLLNKQSNHNEQIREACCKLIITNGLTDMKSLALHTNMSLRNLERKFTEEVGVSPKMYARFKRFHRALGLLKNCSDLH